MARKYAADIDRLIFDLLFQKASGMGYVQLYNSVKEARKQLSYDTFDTHLRNLKGNGLLGMTVKRYFLTDKAYFLHRLKILGFDRPSQVFLDRTGSEEVEKRLKMHLILSYYGQSTCFYQLQSREHFEDFLSRHQLCENNLRLFREYDIEIKGPPRHIKEFFSVYGIEIRIVEEKLKNTVGKISYHYSVPGFSITDILKAVEKNCLEFYYLRPFTASYLQEEVDILLNEGLLERIPEFDNEIRYMFSDHLVLREIRDLFEDLFNIMYTMWKYLRSPKKQEKKWFEFFYGKGEVEHWLQDLRHNRSSNQPKKREAIDHITTSMPEIHKDFENLVSWHKKYTFFIEKLLEYIYPAFMRKSFSSAIVEERRTYAAKT